MRRPSSGARPSAFGFCRSKGRRVTVLHSGAVSVKSTIDEIDADEGIREIYLGTTDASGC
jgi:ABC-type uncharacterized transport system ATPase subunit